MVARKHLFIAVTRTAFGEVLQGRRLAEALVAAGDQVSFIAPNEVQGALAGAPFRRGVLEQMGTTMLDELLPQLTSQVGADSVCLVDLAAFALTLGSHGLPFACVRRIPTRVVALDLWSLGETDRIFDFGPLRQQLPAEVLELPRLVPAPFARPEAPGAYDAWAPNRPLAPDARAAVRAKLGLPAQARLLVTASASWQTPAKAIDAQMLASAIAVPPIVLARAAAADAVVVHVGPAPWTPPSPRYRHLAQLPPAEFQDLIAAADVVVTANLSATTITTALAADVPVVVLTSDGRREVPPYRVWPLGLRHLLGPVLADNPMLACVREVDLFDEAGFAAAIEPDADWLARAHAYRARIAALPGPAARYAQLLTSS